ncbi:Serine/threonine-protein kinase pelle [Nymphon striatum]|nr:Serine/threonine-protein kinase pelle [Nymphon striatum]
MRFFATFTCPVVRNYSHQFVGFFFKFNMSKKSCTYIYEIPFAERKQLCNILDADERWEELAGSYMAYDVITITLLKRKDSPTWELLDKWGQKNHTINDLFVILKNMGHYHAMSVIKNLVDVKYHYLLDQATQKTARHFLVQPSKNTSVLPLPTLPTHDSMSSKTDKGACGGPSKSSYHDPINLQHTNQYKTSYNKYGDSSKFQKSAEKLKQEDKWHAEKSNVSLSPSGYFPMKGEDVCISMDENTFPEDKILNSKEPGAAAYPCEHKIINEKRTSLPSNVQQSLKSNDSRVRKSSRDIENALHSTINIDYKEILDATNDFDSSKLLGSGGFGEVYRGNWKNTEVAIKRLRPKKLRSEGLSKISNNGSTGDVSINQSLVELRSLINYRHDNILPLYGISIGGPEPCLVYQFMLNGSLEDRLLCRKNTSPLLWIDRSNISRGTARGLQFLHTSGTVPLIHGDIKSANVLLDSNLVPKIGDFGLARDGPTGHYTHVEVSALFGTQYYLPEEYLRSRKLSTKVDTYSFGIVLFEIGSGLRCYEGKRSNRKPLLDVVYENQDNISELRDKKAGEKHSDWFYQLIELGMECTSSSKKKRPEMVQVLQKLEFTWQEEELKEKARKISRTGQSLPSDHDLPPVAVQAYYDERKKLNSLPSTHNNACASGLPADALEYQPPSFSDDTNLSLLMSSTNNFSNSYYTNENDSLPPDYYDKDNGYYPLLTCLGLKNKVPDEELKQDNSIDDPVTTESKKLPSTLFNLNIGDN